MLRPSDRYRLYYLILLYLLIQYDVFSGFLPDAKIDIPILWQNIVEFATAVLMSAYFTYYFYKAFQLTRLKFFASWGTVFFLLLPFILFSIIPYWMTEDLQVCRKAAAVVSCMYTVCFTYFLFEAIKEKSQQSINWAYKTEAVGICFGVLFWVTSLLASFFEKDINEILDPIVHVRNGSEVVALLSTNFSLLAVTILFIRRQEEYQFQHAQMLIEEVNSDLINMVQKRTSELQVANQEKTNTVINVAHEVKTRLTVMHNILEDYIAKHGQTKELITAKYCYEQITKDINNLSDLERLEKGFDFYHHQQVSNFSDILLTNTRLFRELAKKLGIDMLESIQSGVMITADPEAISRIVKNLIENAIKFSHENGRIHLTLNADQQRIQFSITDTGIGIHPQEHDKIFNSNYQIKTEKKNFQGRGLGLAIVKKIVDSLDAKIWVVSNPDLHQGTCISIDFKIPGTEKNQKISEFKIQDKLYLELDAENPLLENEMFDDTKPYILIVEDSITLLNWITIKLKENYNVYVAESGRQALEKLKIIKRLDLIISDIIMEGMDGFEFLQKVSEQKKLLHIPFIFITAKSNVHDKIQGFTLGAIGYINKPFQLAELTAKIASVLKIMDHQRTAVILHAYETMLGSGEKTATKKQRFENNCNKFCLTAREVEVALLISKGNTYKEIAISLFISEHTVKTHMKNIFEKTGAISKVALFNILEA